jgi:hypothetical protein
MKSTIFSLITIAALLQIFASESAKAAKSDPWVSTMFFTAVDADFAAEFAIDILSGRDEDIFESSLTEEQRWLELPDTALSLRFTTALNNKELADHYEKIYALDNDMTVYTDWMNTHGAIQVPFLSPIMSELTAKGAKYLGPFKNDHGVNQLVVRIPGAGYLTLESKEKPIPSSTPGVSSIFFTAVDADIAADFTRDVLSAEDEDFYESTLGKKQRWLAFEDSELNLRFSEAKDVKALKKHYDRIYRFDRGMTVYTDWMNTHGAIRVKDLYPAMKKLTEKGAKFLGPIKKDLGVYQIVVRVPGAGYLTLESTKKPMKEFRKRIINWDLLVDVSRGEVANELFKGKSYGGTGGIPFDDSSEIVGNDTIAYIEAEWNTSITKLNIGYQSGTRIKHGKKSGKLGKRYDLDKDEMITSVAICRTKFNEHGTVKGLLIVTTKRYMIFGTIKQGEYCTYSLFPKDSHVVGFYGSFGSKLDNIGTIYTLKPKLDHELIVPKP